MTAGAARPRLAPPGLASLPLPALLVLLALAGCAAPNRERSARSAHDSQATRDLAPTEPPDDAEPPEPGNFVGSPTAPASGAVYQRGVATYYADSLSGRPTATGEPYNPNELTAAHRTLPFGAVVDVARPDGRHVTVRINDRGPFAKNRIIDLSRRAARAIGLVEDGVAKVLLRVVSMPEKRRRRR